MIQRGIKQELVGSLGDREEKIACILRAILASESEIDQDKEHFWVLGFNTKLRLKYVDLVSLGTLDASLVHPREVFRAAIHRGAAVIFIGHNHPSGYTDPSSQDVAVTERLVEAGKLLGISVMDHIIIGTSNDDHYHSMNRMGNVTF